MTCLALPCLALLTRQNKAKVNLHARAHATQLNASHRIL
jgi:hypothetical protein